MPAATHQQGFMAVPWEHADTEVGLLPHDLIDDGKAPCLSRPHAVALAVHLRGDPQVEVGVVCREVAHRERNDVLKRHQ
jgi:hypothetical protein